MVETEIKDLYNHKERYKNWLKRIKRKRKIKHLNDIYSDLIIKYLQDMAIGLNVSIKSKKGARSPARLNALRIRLTFVFKKLQERKISDIEKITAKDLHNLFEDMRSGVIKTRQGTTYKSVADYVKVFKAFWHWYMKVNEKQVEDITTDLDMHRDKPKFVYFTKEDADNMINKASCDLKPILALAFDAGMRVTELMNIKVSDFSADLKELNIREETSKTFGRRIKLMLCSEQIKVYVKKLGLKPDNFVCRKNPPMINKELRELGQRILKPEQIKYKQLSLYDWRHSSCCFWLPRYKSESALKYRFGWVKSDMIHYYSEFLGMKDTITEDDLYVGITKTELEKENKKIKKSISMLEFKQKETMAILKKRHTSSQLINALIKNPENLKLIAKEMAKRGLVKVVMKL